MSFTGPAAMPNRHSESAPFFSDRSNEVIEEFLSEFDLLATTCELTDRQKVEAVVRYVPHRMRDFWKSLDGYDSGNWLEFRNTLVGLYPDRVTPRYTEQDLLELVDRSRKTRMRHEEDVVKYYRHFLTISHQLLAANRTTEYIRDIEFFCGFHPDHAEALLSRLFAMKPEHPAGTPYDIHDVFIVACEYFIILEGYSDHWISRLFWSRGHGHGQDDQDYPPQDDHDRLLNDPEMREPSMEDDDMQELAEMVRKLYHLSVGDVEYAVLWAQCKHRFPSIAQELTKPEMFQVASDQVSAGQPPSQTTKPLPLRRRAQRSFPTSLLDEATSSSTRAHCCAFCALPGHVIRKCPSVDEYVQTGRATIIRGRIYLSGGEPIPNNGSGRGLKHSLDTWLAANSMSSGATSTVTVTEQPSTNAASLDPEPSAPLREIDVHINDRLTDPGVLSQDAQVVVIRADLVREVGVIINKMLQVDMKGINGATIRTLGLVHNLPMRVGNIDCIVQAWAVEEAPFRLLLGQPFYSLLRSHIEDNPDGSVVLHISDPHDRSQVCSVPTRPSRSVVNSESVLAFQIKTVEACPVR